MLATSELEPVRKLCENVAVKLDANPFATRDEIGQMRVDLTKALAQINAVERAMVGVPRPKQGD